MNLYLVVLTPGKRQGEAIPIPSRNFLIGRSSQCNLRPQSPLISKRHCALIWQGRKVIVRDFGSTNGTFINRKSVRYEMRVMDQDVLTIGPLSFSVRLEKPQAICKSIGHPPSELLVEYQDEDSAA